MMNAAKQVLYSGVPQEEWDNTSKYPKILSNGPKILKKTSVKKSRNAGLVSFLILTLVAIVLSLGIVIGLHYLKFTEENGLTFASSNEENTSNNPDNDTDNNFPKPQQPVENDDKKDQHGETDPKLETNPQEDLEKQDEKKDKNSSDPGDQNLFSSDEAKNSSVSPPPTEISPKPETTTEDDWLDIIKTEDQLYPFDDIFDKMTSDMSSDTSSDASSDSRKTKQDKKNHEEKKDDEDEMGIEEGLGEVQNKTIGSKDDEEHESLSQTIRDFAAKYFNSSNGLKKEEILEWIEKLTSRPSLEVIVIASGIIFVGVSLLIVAIACLVTRTRKIRIRREKINKAMSDLEGAEKVILLTDEPSEDEYVKT